MKNNQKEKKFSSNKDSLAGILSDIIGYFMKDIRFYSSMAKVIYVDIPDKTATVQIINGEELGGVRLQQVANNSGLFIAPSVGSNVLVSWTDNTTAYISLYSEIDNIVFQNGTNGGLTITPELVTNLGKTNSYLETLKTATGAIATALDALVPGTSTAFNAAMAGQVVGDFSAIENENFKH